MKTTIISEIVKQPLLQLTEQKNLSLIKDYLENLPKRDKGPVFEWYLAELYAGNGWLTKIQGGRGDLGADIFTTPQIIINI